MPCMPGRIERGRQVRSGVEYAKFGQATWRWWCRRHNVEFAALDQPLGGAPFAELPPTVQRWLAPEMLLREYGREARIAIVDADTMIRWDAPDFFEPAGDGFAAVRAMSEAWGQASIRAYQHLFPETVLTMAEYFNAGFVALGAGQLKTLRVFTDFALERWEELRAVQISGNFGSDQTPLNFVLRREREPVTWLSPRFNMLQSARSVASVLSHKALVCEVTEEILERAFGVPGVFDFIGEGYVWHFTTSAQFRYPIMQRTWERVRRNYPGSEVE